MKARMAGVILSMTVAVLSWAHMPQFGHTGEMSLKPAQKVVRTPAVAKPQAAPLSKLSSRSLYDFMIVYSPPSRFGKPRAMKIVNNRLYLATEKAFHVVDLSDVRRPKTLLSWNRGWGKNIHTIDTLGKDALFLWRKGEPDRITRMDPDSILHEKFVIVDISMPQKPRRVMTKSLYFYQEAQACREYRRTLEELSKKWHTELLKGGNFGYPRRVTVRGDDIYFSGTLGMYYFRHRLEDVQHDGSEILTHTLALEKTFDYGLHRDPKNRCTKKKCVWMECDDDYSDAGGYVVVTQRNVIKPTIMLDRDLDFVAYFHGPFNTYAMADAMEAGDDVYLFAPDTEGNIVTYRIDRHGTRVQVGKHPLQNGAQFRQNIGVKRFGKRLFAYGYDGSVEGGAIKGMLEIFGIDANYRLEPVGSEVFKRFGVLDVDYRAPYLYLLCHDALRILKLRDDIH